MLAMTGRIISGAFLIIVIGLFMAIKFDVEKIPPPPEKIKQNIEVTLPHKIDAENDKWAKFSDGTLQTYKSIEEGSIKIHLPSQRTLNYEVEYGNLIQTDEILDTIDIKLLPGIYDYQEAISNLEKELKKLSVENNQDCISGLKKLREVKNPDRYLDIHLGCIVEIENGVELLAGLSRFSIPTPEVTLKPNLGFTTILRFSSIQQQQKYCCKQN